MSEGSPLTTINPPVFFTSAALLVGFLLFGSLYPEVAGQVFPGLLDSVATHFGWVYVPAVAFMLGFCVWLVVGPWGRLRLGPDDAEPEYGRLTWFSMLFSAGMGIGLLFYGVAEPMLHFSAPPLGVGGTVEAAREALPRTFFHWGLHGWAIYVVLGLAIAWFTYRKGFPIGVRSVLHPFLGDRIHGWPGHVVDILAVAGTLFGLATSLGLGAMQVNSGLNFLFGLEKSVTVQLTLIAAITLAATASLVSGVDKGIRRLSETNIFLATCLLVFVFAVGPTQHILDAFVTDVGRYLSTLVSRSFDLDPRGNAEWRNSWTLFYWGWWMAWAPFVGTFVARISRGRSVREFVLGVSLVPTLVTFIWMTVFGETALYLELETSAEIAKAVNEDVSTAVYVMLAELPMATLTSGLAALVVAVFFVTSSDSASFVVDMLTSGGHPNPPVWQRVFWAMAEGAVAAVLLAAAGRSGLKALQAGVVCIGAPFCIILVLTCIGLARSLKAELAENAPP